MWGWGEGGLGGVEGGGGGILNLDFFSGGGNLWMTDNVTDGGEGVKE